MKPRELVKQNPALSTIGAIILFVFCLGWIIWQRQPEPGQRIDQVYFLDTNTNRIFTARGTIEAVPAPSGPTEEGNLAGYRARIVGCGGCGELTGKTLRKIRQMDDVRVTHLEWRRGEPDATQPHSVPYAVSAPKPVKWTSSRTEGSDMIAANQLNCEEPDRRVACYPEQPR